MITDVDYFGSGPFPLRFVRRFNSWFAPAAPLRPMAGWALSYWQRTVEYLANAYFYDGTRHDLATVTRPGGGAYFFTQVSGQWVTDDDVKGRLVEFTDSNGIPTGWRYYPAYGDTVEDYDASGHLTSITNRNGLKQTLAYDTSGNLSTVTDPFGRQLHFSYDFAGGSLTMTTPDGGVYQYALDGNSRLLTATFPDSSAVTYQYGSTSTMPSGILDENNAQYMTITGAFGSDGLRGQVGAVQFGAGADNYNFSYNSVGGYVKNPFGQTRIYAYQLVAGMGRNTSITGPACPECGPATQTFDANGNVASKTDWDGNRTNYTYDLTRDLETQRVEGLASDGTPTADTRTISTQWHPTFSLPAKVAEPLRITSYVYNGDSGASCGFEADGVTLVPGVLCSKTVQATTDANGSQGFNATLTGTPRTWSYTYNPSGSVLTVDGPRTDVADTTTYTYYANDDPDLGKRANVATITNALGQVTQITAYNANGQPLTVVDPNGLTTTLTYDARERMTSRTVGGELTSYTYDPAGQLTKVTLPDGSYLMYSHDTAHRLTGVQDNLGDHIDFTLDAMGNRTQEQVFDPANNLMQTRSRVYSTINRLYQEIGAANQTTTYTYDNQGNVTQVTDPLSHATNRSYDALNRLAQVTDPNLGVTQIGYNGDSVLTSVTDPRNLVTGYTVDGLGNLAQQSSPDTGTTTNTFDAAGNLLTRTDAKGQTTTYAYDALNRVTSITFQDGSKQTYTYDQGTNGLGRLTGITETDPASQVTDQIDYAYDQHGRVTTETRTINGVAYATGYSYDSFGRLAGMTYPSGRTVTYSFDALGRVGEVDTTRFGQTQVVVQNIQYQPFGGVKGYTLGNGQVYTRTVDQDGRIASYTLGASTYDISFDAASRISGIAESGNPSNTNTYGYDSLNRLTSAVLPSTSYGYSYDAVGNRLTKTVGANTDTYAYLATSNEIASITPATGPVKNFTFDANGSTTDDGLNQYAYDTRGRMVQATTAQGTTTYQLNALGQRFRKTSPTDDRVFLYDTRGHLIAETDPAGTLKREILYLGDIPVGVLQ